MCKHGPVHRFAPILSWSSALIGKRISIWLIIQETFHQETFHTDMDGMTARSVARVINGRGHSGRALERRWVRNLMRSASRIH